MNLAVAIFRKHSINVFFNRNYDALDYNNLTLTHLLHRNSGKQHGVGVGWAKNH